MDWSGLEARQCLELLSWKVDVEWCGFFFSKTLPNNSYADSDITWESLASSLGLVAKLPISSKTTAYAPVKLSGFVVLLGLGGYLCYKLYKVWLYQHNSANTVIATDSRGDDDSPPPPSSFSYRLNGLVPDPSTSINDFINVKTHYFGPLHKKNEDCEQNYSNSGSDLTQCQGLTLQPEILRQNVKSKERLKRTKLSSPPSVNTRRGWLTQKLQCLVPNAQASSGGQSPSNSTCTSSTGSSPISHPHHHSLSRDFSFDSFGLFCSSHRQSSLDSMCSELSFDMPSFTEQTAENVTVARLDKLQEEIDQIKSNCQIMDEEFGTVKCNRNLPGLAELMETTEHLNRDGELSEQDIVRQQNAKACFKGLYSLTTINQSMSMDEDSLQNSNQLSEEELLPSLEWDHLNNWTASTPTDIPLSPILSSKMDTSGYSSKMDLTSSLSGSQFSCFESPLSPGEEVNEAVNSEMIRSMSCDSQSESIDNDNCPHLNIGSRVDIMMYAQQEWTGNTQKAKTILRVC